MGDTAKRVVLILSEVHALNRSETARRRIIALVEAGKLGIALERALELGSQRGVEQPHAIVQVFLI